MVQNSYLRLLGEVSEKECQCGPDNKCEGLECLCRPRFFAGQLLTDEDLRRLDHYIVAKDKLHNRFLHGTGSVCGLEVVCNACDGTVTVRTGYAIGPCGEDIVVCQDTSVDVGELIRELRKQQAKQRECMPAGDRPNEDCGAAEQKWTLAICYEERPSRGMTSLKRPSKNGSCGCGCSSNGNGHSHGHKSGGCGCGGGGGSTKSSSCSCQKSSPAQCEPTLTCEGYRFKVVREKARSKRDDGAMSELMSNSELARRVMACLMKLISQIREILTIPNPTPEILSEFCCDFKADLRNLIETSAVHECSVYARLNSIICPDPADQEFNAKFGQAAAQLFQIVIDLFRSCVCSALLPPCSIGSPDDCVPLATLTVRASDLKVIRICNWSARKFVVTMPTLGYWLGWLPIFDSLRDAIVSLCCAAPREPNFEVNQNLRVNAKAERVQPMQPAQPAQPAQPMESVSFASTATNIGTGEVRMSEKRTGAPVVHLTEQFVKRGNSLSGLEATVLGALGATDTEGRPLATDLEILNPFTSLALTRIAVPMAESIVPNEHLESASRRRKVIVDKEAGIEEATVVAGPTGNEERMAKLEATVAGLQKTVETQRKTIAALKKEEPNQ